MSTYEKRHAVQDTYLCTQNRLIQFLRHYSTHLLLFIDTFTNIYIARPALLIGRGLDSNLRVL